MTSAHTGSCEFGMPSFLPLDGVASLSERTRAGGNAQPGESLELGTGKTCTGKGEQTSCVLLMISYEAAKKRTKPYTKIVKELSEMRRETVQLVRQAVGAGRRAYVLVNNRAEGNAPLTVQGLVRILRG